MGKLNKKLMEERFLNDLARAGAAKEEYEREMQDRTNTYLTYIYFFFFLIWIVSMFAVSIFPYE